MSGDNARGGGGMQNDPPSTPNTDASLADRLKRLDRQLDKVRAEDEERKASDAAAGGPSPLGRAFRLSAEFVAGVAAGAILGWLLDRVLGSSPWGMITLLMLGFGAGIYNVLRAAGHLRSASGDPS